MYKINRKEKGYKNLQMTVQGTSYKWEQERQGKTETGDKTGLPGRARRKGMQLQGRAGTWCCGGMQDNLS